MSSFDSNQFSIGPQVLPAWAASINDLQWGTIASSATISAVAPPNPGGQTGQSAVITAWCGGCYDSTRKAMLITGGGHSDYFGNEVYRLLLNVANPGWARLSDPNGDPPASHNYGHPVYHPGTDAMYLPVLPYFSPNGNSSKETYRFNFSNNAWEFRTTSTVGDSNFIIHGFSDYDPVSDRIYVVANEASNSTVIYNPTANTQQTVGLLLNMGQGMGRIAPSRRAMISILSGAVRYLNLASPTSWVSPTITGSAVGTKAPGIVWHEPSQTYITWGGGQALIKLKPPASGLTGTWTWSSVAGITGVTPTAAAANSSGNMTFGRLMLASFGNRDILLVINGVTQPVYFIKLPLAGV